MEEGFDSAAPILSFGREAFIDRMAQGKQRAARANPEDLLIRFELRDGKAQAIEVLLKRRNFRASRVYCQRHVAQPSKPEPAAARCLATAVRI